MFSLSARSYIRSVCYQTCERDILKTNELILMPSHTVAQLNATKTCFYTSFLIVCLNIHKVPHKMRLYIYSQQVQCTTVQPARVQLYSMQVYNCQHVYNCTACKCTTVSMCTTVQCASVQLYNQHVYNCTACKCTTVSTCTTVQRASVQLYNQHVYNCTAGLQPASVQLYNQHVYNCTACKCTTTNRQHESQ